MVSLEKKIITNPKIAMPEEIVDETVNVAIAAIHPIDKGAIRPPLSEINLHIPKNSPGLFFGDKSDPKVRINPLEIPLPIPAIIPTIVRSRYVVEIGIKESEIPSKINEGIAVDFLPNLSISIPAIGNIKASMK